MLPEGRPTQDYIISSPIATHWRAATCDEVNCGKLAKGFAVLADESTPDGQRRATYIRGDKTRSAIEQRGHEQLGIDSSVTVFVFVPGNRCFEQHEVPLDRPEIYLVRAYDLTMSSDVRRHTSADSWANDAAEHTEKILKKIT